MIYDTGQVKGSNISSNPLTVSIGQIGQRSRELILLDLDHNIIQFDPVTTKNK